VLAVVFAFIGQMSIEVVSFLSIIGIIVGLVNVKDEEIRAFLLSGVVLIIASAFGYTAFGIFAVLERIFNALLIIFVPAVIVVAIRNVFVIATN